ncbi:MAG: helix-turn-helix transcriptional regulator [Methanocellales archaeon]|nr:helix-turn-helix transcriptional regulator [Methanocellales archaeon]MDD3292108.1 helix-turn-helix transcriptional regulator [Methanocellales archaeon]MDD5235345.1 helix-turn-helix transcriptional regulator [Methanocellales archaeon]MDD5485707.1 helix-turn-helix transcriptional regulator [Methanocellales archaeon]
MPKAKPTNRIREIRKGKRMKQAVLADKVGVFQSEISEIETGERKPNIYLAKKIAKVLGKSVDEIFLP